MLTRKSWFVVSCSLALALAILTSAPTHARATESISSQHFLTVPSLSYDQVTYSMNWSGTPYCMGHAVFLKNFGSTQPSSSDVTGTGISEQSLEWGGTGGASENSMRTAHPSSSVSDGAWICYHITGTPSDGTKIHEKWNGAYCYQSLQ
ncbi:MAG: hypothetical protein JWL77_3848 [Chthonomonadaceae bacterium]|nr:hypothetical protein [Chthonomonadaceae bacterium]